jgi:hypothetical protein
MEPITAQNKNPDPFCCDLSREANEVMFGTAPTVRTWFLLEYNKTWNHKATEQNDLSPSVQSWLKAQLALAPGSRLLFIKRNRPDSAAGITFFVALSQDPAPRLYRFSLADYASLLGLDLSAVLSGDLSGDLTGDLAGEPVPEPASAPFLQEEPLILVCTNGKRDRCCAREGPALYQAMADFAGDKAWQCTHLGGHRFAPTLVTLPDGAFYGRLAPAEAEAFVRSCAQGDLFLEKLRGRVIYDPVSQAAEQFLRRQTGIRQRNAYVWLETAALGENRWAVTFQGATGQSQRIIVIQEAPVERLVSCHPLKTKPVTRFRVANTLRLE